MEEEKKDLKDGEEETPAGDDPSEKETSTESEEEEETSEDESDEEESEEEEESDEEVKISKSELERLRKDADQKENYRKAVIRLNRKGRNLPGSDPEIKKKKSVDDESGDDDEKINTDDFVTKAELTTRDEKRAVADACKNEQVALNWDEIIVFYQRPKDNSYDTQLAAIQTAHKLWKADKGITDKPTKEKSEAKKAKQDLSIDKGKGKGKEKKPVKNEKRSIIPKHSSMNDWYK